LVGRVTGDSEVIFRWLPRAALAKRVGIEKFLRHYKARIEQRRGPGRSLVTYWQHIMTCLLGAVPAPKLPRMAYPARVHKRMRYFLFVFDRPWWFFYVDNTCPSKVISEPVEHIVNEDPVLNLLVSIIHIDIVQMNLQMKVTVPRIVCPDLFLPRQPRISTLGGVPQWK
jgi:hypothetical protein